MRAPLAFLAAVLASSVAGLAAAQPSPSDKALAEALFRDGRQLLEAGKLSAACGKFAESQRIDPKLGTLLNLATCHEQEGKTASAWAEFNEAASQAASANQPERVDFAKEHAAALEKRLIRVVLQMPNAPAGLKLALDDRDLSAAALGSAIPVDPGHHAISASAPGKGTWSTTLEAKSGPATLPISIPALADAPSSSPPPYASTPPNEPSEGTGENRRTAGLFLGGVGLVGLGLGAGFGIHALSQQAVVEEHCSGIYCDSAGLDADRSAHTSATISTIAFIAGAACTGAGAILFFTARPSKTKGSSAWRLPSVGISGTQLSIQGSF